MAARRKKQWRKRFVMACLFVAALLIVIVAILLFSQHPSNASHTLRWRMMLCDNGTPGGTYTLYPHLSLNGDT